jgi:polyhydroxybutyrate depolymerase
VGKLRSNGFLCASVLLALAAFGCGEGSEDGGGVAPMAGVGGMTGGQGGLGGNAGTISTGGAGGMIASGGVGGMVASGGVGGSAGMMTTGGVGGGMTGGVGGMTGGVGGGMTGGAGGMMSTGGTGGAAPAMSAGCGKADTPGSDTFTIDVAGLQREYIVKIPSGYDPNHAYKLIFTWHYLGGSAAGIAGGFGGGYYGLESRSAGSAIFVSPEGIDAAWPNTGGRDVAFGRAMVEWMRENYCIDNERIFSTGFSYGGIMSNTAGCGMGDIFRAIAPMAGSGPRSFGGGGCMGEVAAILFHGQSDNVVSFASGQGSRDHWVEANGCSTMTMPGSPSQCVEYTGCNDGYPVVWCEYPGGHTQPSFGPDAIWTFFERF